MTAVEELRPAPASDAARGAAWLAIVAVIAALVLAPPGLGGQNILGAGEVLTGEIEVLRDGDWTALPAGDDVRRDETLRTQVEPARLRVRGGVMWLAPGTEVTVARDTTDLRSGAVLFEGDAVRTVQLGAVEVRGRGAFRVDATPAARAGVYRGGIAVSDESGERSVAPYQQVDLTEGRAGELVALRYVADDPWDERLLAAAIAVDRQVERTVASLRAVYGTQLQRPGFYRDFIEVDDVLAAALPGLSPLARDGVYGPPAETLVAVIVTRLLVDRAGLDVGEATTRIADQRRAGATWGLLLRGHDLRADDLREATDTALRTRAIAVEEGSAERVEDAPPPDAGGGPATTPVDAPPAGTEDEDAPEGEGGPDDGGQDDGGQDEGDGDEEGQDDGGSDDDGGDDEGDGDQDDGDGDPIEDVIDELPLPIDPPPGLERAREQAGEVIDDVLERMSSREPRGRKYEPDGEDGFSPQDVRKGDYDG